MTDNIYNEIRAFAEVLKQSGLHDSSTELTIAIDAGATGTEILMRLDFSLRELVTDLEKVNSQAKLAKQGKQLITAVEELLKNC